MYYMTFPNQKQFSAFESPIEIVLHLAHKLQATDALTKGATLEFWDRMNSHVSIYKEASVSTISMDNLLDSIEGKASLFVSREQLIEADLDIKEEFPYKLPPNSGPIAFYKRTASRSQQMKRIDDEQYNIRKALEQYEMGCPAWTPKDSEEKLEKELKSLEHEYYRLCLDFLKADLEDVDCTLQEFEHFYFPATKVLDKVIDDLNTLLTSQGYDPVRCANEGRFVRDYALDQLPIFLARHIDPIYTNEGQALSKAIKPFLGNTSEGLDADEIVQILYKAAVHKFPKKPEPTEENSAWAIP